MDHRQEQLVAAGEALRTWVHAQRATWSDGYPRAFAGSLPQLAMPGVPALASSSVMADAVAVPSPGMDERAEIALQWLHAWSGPVTSSLSRAVAVLSHSWRIVTVAGLIFLAAWKLGHFQELDKAAGIPLLVHEEDYYTPQWALDDEEWD